MVTGLGAVTPVGLSAPASWASLIAGQSGIGPITHFDATGCTARIAGEVRGYDPTASLGTAIRPRGADSEPVSAPLTPKDVRKLGRFSHLGWPLALRPTSTPGSTPTARSLALRAVRGEPRRGPRRPARDRGDARDLAGGRLPQDIPLLHPAVGPQHPGGPACDPPQLPRAQHEHRLGLRDERPRARRIRPRHPARRRRRHGGGRRRGGHHPGRRRSLRPDEGPLDPQRGAAAGLASLRRRPRRLRDRRGRGRLYTGGDGVRAQARGRGSTPSSWATVRPRTRFTCPRSPPRRRARAGPWRSPSATPGSAPRRWATSPPTPRRRRAATARRPPPSRPCSAARRGSST